MKLHLPIALLAAVVSTMSFAQAQQSGSFSVGQGTYTYSTIANGEENTIIANFTGNGTKGSTGFGANTAWDEKGRISGVTPDYTYKAVNPENNDEYLRDDARRASNVVLTIGDGEYTEGKADTTIDCVSGAGPNGYAVTGNTHIIVKKDATVGILVGAHNYYGGHKSGYVGTGLSASTDAGIGTSFAPKNEAGNIVIDVEGTVSNNIFGGNWGTTNSPLSALQNIGYTGEAMKEYQLNNPAYAINDNIQINVKGGYVGGYIVGAGQVGLSTNGIVNINLTDGAHVKGNVLGVDAKINYKGIDL